MTDALEEKIKRLVAIELNRQKEQQRGTRILNSSNLPQQSRHWDFLIVSWAIVAILSALSAILSAITFQYVLAIIQAFIFVGSLFGLVVGGFRFVILAVFLLLWMFVAFLFTVFYSIALMPDFYNCTSTSCGTWRLFLFQVNYVVNVLVTGLVFLLVRACWIIITQHRTFTSAKMEHSARRMLNEKLD
jgi:hypothetical protein